jgi:hypothetical protein
LAIQPVTYRPISAIKPVTRKPVGEATGKVTDRKRPRRGRTPDPGTGENLDTWA